MQKKIGLSQDQIGLLITLSGFIFLPASIIGGKLTDMIGRKVMILVGDVLALTMYLLAAFTEPSMTMVYEIFMAAFFFGIAEPAHHALMADITTPNQREGASSLSYLGFNLGFTVGPILGGILFENHLSLLFILDALTAFIATVMVLIFVKIDKNKKEEINHDSHLESAYQGSMLSLIKERPIILFYAIGMIGFSFTYAQWGFLLPLHIGDFFGKLGTPFYGILASTNAITVILMTPILTFLLSKRKPMYKVILAGITYLIGFGAFALTKSLVFFVLFTFVFTLGEIILAISSTPFMLRYTPSTHRGRVNSFLNIVMSIGNGLGPITMGYISKAHGYTVSWSIIASVMFVSLVYMFILNHKIESKWKIEEGAA
jgi:MFS family permease